MSLNNLCTYLLKYKHKYSELSNNVIGYFKRSEAYRQLQNGIDSVLSVDELGNFITECLQKKQDALYFDETSAPTFQFLTTANKFPDTLYGTTKFTETQLQAFKVWTDKAEIEYYASIQMSHSAPSNGNNSTNSIQSSSQDSASNATLNVLHDLHEDLATDPEMSHYFAVFQDKMIDRIDKTINTRLSTQIEKHLGTNKQLSSQQVIETENKLGFSYQSYIKQENHIKVLESHLKNDTTPESISHNRFPKPYHVFNNDAYYIAKYNEIIETAQKSMMELAIDRFHKALKVTKADIDLFKNVLSYHVEDIEITSKDIHDMSLKAVQKDIDSSHVKANKSTKKPFNTARSTEKKGGNKQKDNQAKSKPKASEQPTKNNQNKQGQEINKQKKPFNSQKNKQVNVQSSTFNGNHRPFGKNQQRPFNALNNISNIQPTMPPNQPIAYNGNFQQQPIPNYALNPHNSSHFFHPGWANHTRG